MAKGSWITGSIVFKIFCIFHDPLSLFGLLPSPYGFCYVDVYVVDIAHGKGMKSYVHCLIIADLQGLVYEFLCHWKYGRDGLGTGTGHFLVLSLRTIGTPELDEMHP